MMKQIKYTSLVMFGIALLGIGVIYGLSEIKLRNVSGPPPFNYLIKTDSVTLERGRHIARTRGCFGCHGQQLQGRVFTDEWDWVVRAVAPNLAVYSRQHNASTLEAAIRHGIGHNGKALWSMPSYNWVHLTDEDTAALIAYLRSVPIVQTELPSGKLGFKARMSIATGQDRHMAEWVKDVPPLKTNPVNPQLQRGKYLAMTTCNECHGPDLRGVTQQNLLFTPDLSVVAAYSKAEFQKLMSDGITRDGRNNLGLMTMVAKDRFAHFTNQELEDLQIYLMTLASKPAPENVSWRPSQ